MTLWWLRLISSKSRALLELLYSVLFAPREVTITTTFLVILIDFDMESQCENNGNTVVKIDQMGRKGKYYINVSPVLGMLGM